MKNIHKIGKELFITSNEEIKYGDYFIRYLDRKVYKSPRDKEIFGSINKIILTTDQDLIKDGVQAIDNEFLEWFVKNPNCEFVEVEIIYDSGWNYGYKIILPKEEAENCIRNCGYGEEPKPKSFEESVRPLMKYLANNHHPHTSVYVRCDVAELLEGKECVVIKDYILD